MNRIFITLIVIGALTIGRLCAMEQARDLELEIQDEQSGPEALKSHVELAVHVLQKALPINLAKLFNSDDKTILASNEIVTSSLIKFVQTGCFNDKDWLTCIQNVRALLKEHCVCTESIVFKYTAFLTKSFCPVFGYLIRECHCSWIPFPDFIAHFVHLEKLTFSYRTFQKLPASLHLLNKLRILNLSHNNCITLPSWIGNLRALEELDIRNFLRISVEQVKDVVAEDFRSEKSHKLIIISDFNANL